LSASATPVLRLTNASKRFGGVQALDGVDLELAGGEVHALLGQNGSGKSTLVKILAGFHTPEDGARLELWGAPVDFPLVSAQQHGIAVIHQDLGLVDSMTVLENLGVTSSYGTRALFPVKERAERRIGKELLARMRLDIPLDALVRELSPAQRAGVAIARATRALQGHGDRHVFIVDEPTTYLSADEAERMVELIRTVAQTGSSVVFITHRLAEALDVADAITVLRDGRVADRFAGGEGDQSRVIRAMLGRDLDRFYPEPPPARRAVRLKVTGLSGGSLEGISFEAREGEVVGVAGLVGAGHESLPYLLSGARPADAGAVSLDGHDLARVSFRDRLARGIVLIPGNRQRDGLWMAARAWENITLSHLPSYRRAWGLQLGKERRASKTLMERLGVRPPAPESLANEFSGGNQQKIVLAKWLYKRPELLLLDEPTQGIDAGAKREILDLVVDLASQGTVVLLSSGDYEQLANVCNRILVVRNGRLAAVLAGDEVTEQRITEEAQGVSNERG
jgi:ribose transport system ATP-binding protein